jgi:hypothetical protein
MKKPWFPYVLPFALFLLLTGPVRYFPAWSPFLYIAKTIFVGPCCGSGDMRMQQTFLTASPSVSG